MPKMRVAQVPYAKGPFEMVERDIPEPVAGKVRVKVQACGVCHSDSVTKEGLFPGIEYPRVPGHEIIGTVDAIGPGVAGWQQGQRVGVGWHGGNCGYCDACRHGNGFACQTETKVTGLTTALLPAGTLRVSMAAPAPVITAHPMSAPTSAGIAAGTGMTLRSATTARSAKQDSSE